MNARRAVYAEYQRTKKPAVKIWFPYDVEDVERVKTLSGHRYYNLGGVKFWTTPLQLRTVQKLHEWGFDIDLRLQEYRNQETTRVTQAPTCSLPTPRDSSLALYMFQGEGVRFVEIRNGRALIGDDMGTGKTIQALSWLALRPELGRVIIVVPASVKLKWERELRLWTNRTSIQILEGEKPVHAITANVVILNYDILANKYEEYRDQDDRKKYRELPRTGWVDFLIDSRPDVVIIDECHRIKNNQAFRTKAVKKLCRGVPHLLGLSGTLVKSKPIELYNALKLVDSPDLPNYKTFTKRYCDAKHNGFGWDVSGHSNMLELHERLGDWGMIRRTKAEVLPQLPKKMRSVVPLEITNREEYNRARTDFIQWVFENKGLKSALAARKAETLVRVGVLKQLAATGKMKGVVGWIRDTLEDGQKLVVFATHKKVINQLMEEFGKIAVKLDGSVPTGTARQVVVDLFQTDPAVQLFVGNIQAAGEAIDLFAADRVAFAELADSPGDHDQCEDRVLRIGQKSDKMNSYYLVASNTIEEEKCIGMIDNKREISTEILDGKKVEETELLTALLSRVLKEGKK